jgi:hypothetical protein
MFDAVSMDGGVHLAFGVTGYEFPDIADDWCLVRVAVRQGGESFEAVDPAIEATELPAIRDWFRALAADRLPRYATLGFTEPCLAFEFLARDDAGVRFAVHLCGELRPRFPLRQLGFEDAEWRVVFHFTPVRLGAVAASAEAALGQFPVRRCAV